MSSAFSMTSFDLFETLETKLSCSALGAHAIVEPTEPDPGPLPPEDPFPIPPHDPSGPVGPGAHHPHTMKL